MFGFFWNCVNVYEGIKALLKIKAQDTFETL